MKSIAVVCVLALAAVALAADEQVPTLPGLGSPCLPRHTPVNVRWQHRFEKPAPKTYKGMCVRESACSPLNTVHGYCAGIGVVCCKGGGSVAAVPRIPTSPSQPGRPVLQAGGDGCVRLRGTCIPSTSCAAPNVRSSGLCPGAANIQCCHPPATTTPPVTPPVPSGTAMNTPLPIPAGINAGLQFPSAAFQIGKLGNPGCALSRSCFECNCGSSALIKSQLVTLKVTDTVSITGLRPFVETVKQAFDDMLSSGRADAIQARREVKSYGGLCCRPIKRPDGSAGGSWSNHSWGMAVDFSFVSLDQRGDRRAQRGLAIMAEFFNKRGLYWAAGYAGKDEDAMHFEASQSLVNSWVASRRLRTV